MVQSFLTEKTTTMAENRGANHLSVQAGQAVQLVNIMPSFVTSGWSDGLIALLHIYIGPANFTPKPRFRSLNP